MSVPRAFLSSLWVFVLLNIIFRDLHELFRPGLLQEMMTGVVNGVPMAETTLLIAGMVLEIPIAMVVLARVLPWRTNRWANVVAAALSILALAIEPPRDLDDVWFLLCRLVGLVLIIGIAWRTGGPHARGALDGGAG